MIKQRPSHHRAKLISLHVAVGTVAGCGVFSTSLIDPDAHNTPSDTVDTGDASPTVDTNVQDTSDTSLFHSGLLHSGDSAAIANCPDPQNAVIAIPPDPIFTDAPVYYGIGLQGVVTPTGQLLDFDADGALYSTTITFRFYDATPTYICSVTADASFAQSPTTPWLNASNNLWLGWTLQISGNLATDCGLLDPNIYGTDDIRTLVDQRRIWFGLAPMVELRTDLQAAVDSQLGAGTWAADWEDQVFALLTDVDLIGFGTETGYAFAYETTACSSASTGLTGQYIVSDCPTQASFQALVSAQPYMLYSLSPWLP